jgi:triphosphatase
MTEVEREAYAYGPIAGGLPFPPEPRRLASGDLPAPREAARIRLKREMTVEAAVREIMRECADQIAANIEFVWMSEHPEGPHQLRIGLRRLRCIFAIFANIAQCDEMDRLNAEARWLAREASELRDLDVIRDEIVGAEAKQHGDETSLCMLTATLGAQAIACREGLCAALVTPRVQAFLLDLVKFVETRGWLASMSLTQRTQLAMPARNFAHAALERRWQKVRKRGRNFRTLTVEQRHELRKELKRLRYAIEFFSSLYKAKHVRPLLRHMKGLQEVFGALNDAQMARTILERPELAPRADTQAQRAVGWVLGASQARAEIAWRDAQGQWRKFKASKPFWR